MAGCNCGDKCGGMWVYFGVKDKKTWAYMVMDMVLSKIKQK